MEFMMKLNEGYEVIRGSILMMSPLPSISEAYMVLIQEEKHKQLYSSHTNSDDNMTFAVAKRRFIDYSERCKNFNNTSERYNNNSSERYNKNSYNNESTRWSNLHCDHCNMSGHTKHKCYKLVGYQTDEKECNNLVKDDNISITANQYDLFVQMMNQQKQKPAADNDTPDYSAHVAGTHFLI